MLDFKPVQEGRDAVRRFATRLVDHLDIPLYLETSTGAREAQDYVIGATRAVGTNLLNAAVHLQHYRQLRFAQDSEQRTRMRNGQSPLPDASANRYHERELELDAAEQGYFSAFGAVLDCLAPVIVGVTGIGQPLRRVDYGNLLPRTAIDTHGSLDWSASFKRSLAAEGTDLRNLQVSALRALSGATEAAGPSGWLRWALGQRNTYLHREHRTEWIVMMKEGRERRPARLPPTNPDASNTQGLKMAEMRQFRGFYLEEDLLAVLDGLTSSLVTAVQATLDELERVLDQRLSRPALTLEAQLEWSAPVETCVFKGYSPGSSTIDSQADAVVMNPEDIKRLKWAGLLDSAQRGEQVLRPISARDGCTRNLPVRRAGCHNSLMATRDSSKPGLIANCVFAVLWIALGVWTVATPGPAPWRWILPVAYLALATTFVIIGIRRHRAPPDIPTTVSEEPPPAH